ncbi:MgtC/SapB family protein [Aquibacillus salsiterrae]|uniref:MgtC/SapB family protein n=1 Tax=Aquibacillus salsiterrae TaxID=2950439 RepID=A0A9X3WEY2_9BACI|nr:MgtC/SapB family protein [Aquibacillus salsiterrae]MDC3417763.1 MgtC/SapB family protein [Aquibacillus salsiterrae]
MITYIFDDRFLLIMSRIIIALVLSGLIGFERELKNHSAGFRTHILVGVSSCLMMLLSLYGFNEYVDGNNNIQFDPTRIPSYVISGIGFLGAGTIIVNGVTIRGLTTAASIWAVAGLGLVVGAGMYGEAVFTTIIILLSLVLLNNFENLFLSKQNRVSLQLLVGQELKMEVLLSTLEGYQAKIEKLEIEKEAGDNRSIFIQLHYKSPASKYELYDNISRISDVKQVNETH